MDWEDEQTDEIPKIPSKIRCAKCHRAIEYGSNVFRAEEGFNGPRGFVPLSESFILCSEKCVAEHFGGNGSEEAAKMSRRIP